MYRPTAVMASPRSRSFWVQATPHVTTMLCLLAMGFTTVTLAQSITPTIPGMSERYRMHESGQGWTGLNSMLDAITPSINTDAEQSGEQIAHDIETLINRGDASEALAKILDREALLKNTSAPGTDVQLMFQKARALAALERMDEAQAIYQHMTLRYPELPEPWNNLALIYVKQGQLGQAEEALKTAVMNNPDNTNAVANLADLQRLLKMHRARQTSQKSP